MALGCVHPAAPLRLGGVKAVDVGTAGFRSQASSHLLWAQGSQRPQGGSFLPLSRLLVRPAILVIPWLVGLVDASPDLCFHHVAVSRCLCPDLPVFIRTAVTGLGPTVLQCDLILT